ncbi:acyl-CoA dehydrogenase family protein [Rhodococcus sp. IEGM 1366]|uniref:acyl-CoA dehydrogenase family protein n=1 Tax=Rhodococcus sp. IEGM 1366 TaxID=3082223 RepID=UPI002954FA98|nr:acyl-CoA dehydrogenase family protein [Rhodococcus sp. IEGM 1366]MDV8071025.1 acyl-CoA dehydrogenase family protein [Rhodococcus sp. IEGM 1366]
MSDSTQDIGALAESVFTESCPLEKVRTLMAGRDGFDRAMWRRWAKETGLPGIGISENFGGAEFSVATVVDVFEAAGSTLVCAPLFSTAGLTVPLIQASGDTDAARRWLPGIADGSVTASVVLAATRPVHATPSTEPGTWTLDGAPRPALDAATSDVLLVQADTSDGSGVFLVETDACAGLTRTPLMSLDLTRRQASVALEAVPAIQLGTGADWVDAALDTSRVFLAAELIGVTRRCLAMTVEYTSGRIQFGRPVGSFQTIKQRVADLLIKLELARSAVWHAASAVDRNDPDRAVSAALALAFAAETALSTTAEAIQLHGGVGFTWEHDVHLYYKRALSAEHLLGTISSHWERIANHLDHVA